MEIPGNSPQGQTLQVQKSKKTLQTSVSVQIFKGHDITITKSPNKCVLFGRVAGRNRTWQHSLRLVKVASERCPVDRQVQSGDVWP